MNTNGRIRRVAYFVNGSLMAFLVLGCAQEASTPENVDKPLPVVRSGLEDPNGNFVFYVSNQSFAITPVDIQVSIDGTPVVHEYFAVGDQHNWKRFTFRLEPGPHTLSATTKKGDATISKKFRVIEKHWAVLDFWYYPRSHYSPTPRHFTFRVQDKPVAFK